MDQMEKVDPRQEQEMFDREFYKGKRVFITGHTGFKGSWLCRILVNAGAEVTGYSLYPPTKPNLFELAGLEHAVHNIFGDIRDFEKLEQAFEQARPEIVLHLAAQPIVRDSYKDPRYTYETNVMGTVNILECIRKSKSVRSFLNVTTDKVYRNREWEWGYREEEELDGYDPYSNSKSCSELVTHSYKSSFFAESQAAISTARAGNVIGGGDFATDRIIPDCVRAVKDQRKIGVRNRYSVRPYQHVLEPLTMYLLIAQKQYEDSRYAGYYNVGPDECDCITTGALAELFCKYWGEEAKWESQTEESAPHEARFLRLDCSRIKERFGWRPYWHMEKCMEMTCRFYKIWLHGGDVPAEMDFEIAAFLEGEEKNEGK